MLQDAHLYSGYKQQHYGDDLNNIKDRRCLRIGMEEGTTTYLGILKVLVVIFEVAYTLVEGVIAHVEAVTTLIYGVTAI